jgi:hypothetical protein
LDEEGIFRKSGSLNRIKEIQNLYNMGQPVAYEGKIAIDISMKIIVLLI